MVKSLFYFWLLLTPFSWVISYYSGVIALDKILAPLLLALSFYTNRNSESVRTTKIVIYVLLILGLISIKHISFVFSPDIFLPLFWDDLIKAGYFVIPLLYISDLKTFHQTGWVVTFIAIIGLLSTFFVAIGLLDLPLQRFEVTRIGVESLQKSIGIFPSYGDLAQFVSFAIMWVSLVPGVRNVKARKWSAMRFIMLVTFVLGIIGAQSRNVLISGILTLCIYWLLQRLARSRADARAIASTLVGIFGVMALSLVLFFSTYVVDGLSNIGGGLAQSTASVRLDQYAYGWEVISNSPLLGASVEEYRATGGSVNYIHNMWIKLAAIGGIFSALLLVMLLTRIFTLIRKTAYVPVKRKEAMVATSYFGVLLFSTLFYGAMNEMFWVLLGVVTSLTCFKPYGPPRRMG